MKISDVLWKAANRHLASHSEDDKDTATCLAVLNVEGLRNRACRRSYGVTFGGWCRKHSPAVGYQPSEWCSDGPRAYPGVSAAQLRYVRRGCGCGACGLVCFGVAMKSDSDSGATLSGSGSAGFAPSPSVSAAEAAPIPGANVVHVGKQICHVSTCNRAHCQETQTCQDALLTPYSTLSHLRSDEELELYVQERIAAERSAPVAWIGPEDLVDLRQTGRVKSVRFESYWSDDIPLYAGAVPSATDRYPQGGDPSGLRGEAIEPGRDSDAPKP